MREMELTTLLTEVQDIQKFTKNRRQKNGGFAGDVSTCCRFKPGPLHLQPNTLLWLHDQI